MRRAVCVSVRLYAGVSICVVCVVCPVSCVGVSPHVCESVCAGMCVHVCACVCAFMHRSGI